MLKRRDVSDCPILFPLMLDEEVYPYVREKSSTLEEYYFHIKRMIEDEENGHLISRTIMDERANPIGSITLYDIQNQTGFLSTWIGKPYFGQGYNQKAKDSFFYELFLYNNIEKIFLKVRQENIRSQRALAKFNYIQLANHIYPETLSHINSGEYQYNLYVIYKDSYLFHLQTVNNYSIEA